MKHKHGLTTVRLGVAGVCGHGMAGCGRVSTAMAHLPVDAIFEYSSFNARAKSL
jgi:hypothetical protein